MAARTSSRTLPGLSRDELARYGRQLILPEVGVNGQKRLKASSVLIVGAGGLGTAAAAQLAAAGVGRIGVVDGDNVERSNLQRQHLFTEEDLRRNKASAAKSRIRGLNPNIAVESYPMRLDSSNAAKLIRGYDLVVDSTDNLPSRYLINDACVFQGKPDVYASALRFDGQVSVFHPPKGPCYRCLFPLPPPPESVETCEQAGVLGTVPGIMGAVQALQAIGMLLERGSPLVGRLLIFSALDSSFEEVKVRRNPDCAVCGRRPTVRRLIDYEVFCNGETAESSTFEMSPVKLAASIERGDAPLLLDVREPYEFEICHLKRSKLIPLSSLPRRINELDRRKPIVVYCHHGNRSATAVSYLRNAGFNATNLKGGIVAWRELVDPSLPDY